MATDLAQLFPDGAFEFQMGLRRGSDAFFVNQDASGALLAERRRWLAAEPHRYMAELMEAAALVEETVRFARELKPTLAASSLRALGESWEPDFLLLKANDGGEFRLVAGCVCFPSHWALETKMGHPLAAIHAPVPTLNSTLGNKIDTFLQRLRPSVVWERSNWGLAATPELNNHPARDLPRLRSDTPIERTWLRLEHQAFRQLPASGGILFGIRIEVIALADLPPEMRTRIAAAVRAMPPEIAAYKGLP